MYDEFAERVREESRQRESKLRMEQLRWIPVSERLSERRKMTNKEVFEILFDISMEQLREMPGDALIKWGKETNKVLWGGFNGGIIPSFQAEEGET